MIKKDKKIKKKGHGGAGGGFHFDHSAQFQSAASLLLSLSIRAATPTEASTSVFPSYARDRNWRPSVPANQLNQLLLHPYLTSLLDSASAIFRKRILYRTLL